LTGALSFTVMEEDLATKLKRKVSRPLDRLSPSGPNLHLPPLLRSSRELEELSVSHFGSLSAVFARGLVKRHSEADSYPIFLSS
jgi:hypothetical protein